MAGIAGAAVASVVGLLESPTTGVNIRIAAMELQDTSLKTPKIASISARNVSVELAEQAGHVKYPTLLVYCDRQQNQLKEKFRRFSGQVHMVIEIRHSQDKLDGIEENVQVYVDAVCALLDNSRGNWAEGAFYGGGYIVAYETVVKGGKNFLERAKVGFDLEVSR